jgi:hypothetical protein
MQWLGRYVGTLESATGLCDRYYSTGIGGMVQLIVSSVMSLLAAIGGSFEW